MSQGYSQNTVKILDAYNNEHNISTSISDLIDYYRKKNNKFIGFINDTEPVFEGILGGIFTAKNKVSKKYLKNDKNSLNIQQITNLQEITTNENDISNSSFLFNASYMEEMTNFTFDLSSFTENETFRNEELENNLLNLPSYNHENETFSNQDSDVSNLGYDRRSQMDNKTNKNNKQSENVKEKTIIVSKNLYERYFKMIILFLIFSLIINIYLLFF